MNGVINFLKPPGMSSNGAVVFLRGLLGKKTGHTGTLDPGACGVLPICVGKATKISDFLMGGTKEYIAEITFGKSTDTGDSYGQITKTSDNTFPTASEVKHVLSFFCGSISQQTPAYSAVKYQGKKLYQYARQGIEVPRKDRNIVIYEITYISQIRADAHLIRVLCGKGTYIRVLCEDIGKKLNTHAYMSFLVRSKCASLDISNAYTADELIDMNGNMDGVLLTMDMFLTHMPSLTVGISQRKILFNGGSVDCLEEDTLAVRIYVENAFFGIGCVEKNRLKITTLLVDR